MKAVKFNELNFGEVFVLRTKHENSSALRYQRLGGDKYRVQGQNTEIQYKWTKTDELNYPVIYRVENDKLSGKNKLIQWLSNV